MIDAILGNKTNIIILRFLTKFDSQFFPVEEIVKGTGCGLRNIHDSIKYLLHEGIIDIKTVSIKKYYRFMVDSKTKEIIYRLFEEERKRISLRTTPIYKILAELELKIIKIFGSNLLDILLFGSVAKGRDTLNSDIDLCILIEKEDEKSAKKIRALQFDNKCSNEVQFHVFTSEEFLKANRSGNELVSNILKDGISLRIGK